MSIVYEDDVHYKYGVSCTDCHGGDPKQDEGNAVMNASRGFKVRVTRENTPEYCGRCHSDAFFWDTADAYGSHAVVKVALKKLPREKVTILTKTDARTVEQLKPALDRYFQEMGTDCIDIVLLHSRMNLKWDELDKGLMDLLSKAKQAKKVRAVGISCHSLGALKVAAKSPLLDVCLCRINPAGVRMDAPTEQVLPLMADLKANGKGVLGMKILGEGQLRDRVDEALRFAVTKDAIHAFTIGVESRDELKDLLARIPKVSQPA